LLKESVAATEEHGSPARFLESVGRGVARSVEAFGFGAHLFFESFYWLIMGRRVGQRVRSSPIFAQMMVIGVNAIPIVSILSVAIGITLSMQGINSLEQFGAQHQVIFMVALSVTREFGPLITGILVAGRSGSALAARISTMVISQEIDALKVMGINPVRYMVVPSLIGMMIVLPALTLWSIGISLVGSAFYVAPQIGTTIGAYFTQVNASIDVDDLAHGLTKSLIFAVLITIVSVINGISVKGGAEGVGRVTTSAVVHGILAIVLTDMIFVFMTTG
jgi:phospholipid/cholesterol/gamma-HCH transport system permease protein